MAGYLRQDTPIDPAKITELVRASRSPYRLTPDMRLTRRFAGELEGYLECGLLCRGFAVTD